MFAKQCEGLKKKRVNIRFQTFEDTLLINFFSAFASSSSEEQKGEAPRDQIFIGALGQGHWLDTNPSLYVFFIVCVGGEPYADTGRACKLATWELNWLHYRASVLSVNIIQQLLIH